MTVNVSMICKHLFYCMLPFTVGSEERCCSDRVMLCEWIMVLNCGVFMCFCLYVNYSRIINVHLSQFSMNEAIV